MVVKFSRDYKNQEDLLAVVVVVVAAVVVGQRVVVVGSVVVVVVASVVVVVRLGSGMQLKYIVTTNDGLLVFSIIHFNTALFLTHRNILRTFTFKFLYEI